MSELINTLIYYIVYLTFIYYFIGINLARGYGGAQVPCLTRQNPPPYMQTVQRVVGSE